MQFPVFPPCLTATAQHRRDSPTRFRPGARAARYVEAVSEEEDQERAPVRHPSKIISGIAVVTLATGIGGAVAAFGQAKDHIGLAALYSGQPAGRLPFSGFSDSPDDSSPTVFSQLSGAGYAAGGSISAFHWDGPSPSGLAP